MPPSADRAGFRRWRSACRIRGSFQELPSSSSTVQGSDCLLTSWQRANNKSTDTSAIVASIDDYTGSELRRYFSNAANSSPSVGALTRAAAILASNRRGVVSDNNTNIGTQ
eukprot:TRINITY_DN12120_c0_g1_i1.p2 TRINITY_DN12120_c0_g1~~TRINITY_DN12120_c0_g1_i1.p2  ORF type:complete len:111 (+),score=13.54 TRINITY_DN12120_c0_g1_i1:435-767(+)